MPDGHSSPQPAEARQVPTLSLDEVMQRFVAAGIGRSRRSLIRYCQNGILDGRKENTASGETWFVTEASVERAVQQISNMIALTDTARHSSPEPAMPGHDAPSVATRIEEQASPDMDGNGQTQRAMAGHGALDFNIYEHPYVKRLEDQVERLEDKYEAQVRRTEEIQLKGQAQLLELQRMTAVGQSQTLADFMLKARDWVIGQGSESDKNDTDAAPAT